MSSGQQQQPTSSAFSRLNRPGSGRMLTAKGDWDTRAAAGSSSSTPVSLSPTSPMSGGGGGGGSGLVAEHRINRPGLPVPGGGLLPAAGAGGDYQQEKRQGLKISFSTPNIRKAATLASKNSSAAAPQILSFARVASSEEKSRLLLSKGAHSTGKLKFGTDEFDFKAEDLEDEGEIGRGAFGTVNKMVFARGQTSKIMAVKRIRSTVDEREQKELLMDLEVVMRSNDCPFIVLFFGAIFKEGDCWICMELMDTSTDKFYKFIYERENDSIPERVIGRIAVATVRALNYLKEKLKIIHRDVKPSNILLDRAGNIKLCDFGISGQLVDSIAKTRDAGCRPYMAPERIDPQRAKGYDVRSDVWSLGITLIELATGCFPYPKWNSVFEQLQQVVHGDPPRLDPTTKIGNNLERHFTVEFVNFVNTCLIKEESQRPKYVKLLEHPFIRSSESQPMDIVSYVEKTLSKMAKLYAEEYTMDTS